MLKVKDGKDFGHSLGSIWRIGNGIRMNFWSHLDTSSSQTLTLWSNIARHSLIHLHDQIFPPLAKRGCNTQGRKEMPTYLERKNNRRANACKLRGVVYWSNFIEMKKTLLANEIYFIFSCPRIINHPSNFSLPCSVI
jgi:hypothetical protein